MEGEAAVGEDLDWLRVMWSVVIVTEWHEPQREVGHIQHFYSVPYKGEGTMYKGILT